MELAQSTLSASFIDKGARQLLLSLLGRLEQGQLLLRDGNERHSFGVAGTDLHAEVIVQDPAFYRRLLLGGSIAAGETWVEGLWTSPDPVALVRLLARNLTLLDTLERRLGWLSFPFNKVRHWLNRNTLTGSRSNIAAHYDLGNTLYQGFLDSHMQYSSAIYPSAEATLEQGQQAKLRTICERLELRPDDHLLEIGTGWGGLAVYAARHYGCRVTTTTISQAQHDYAKEWIAREGLEDRITLLLEDYRKLEGSFDKLVSIEMIEAVGHAFLPDYFRQLSRLLRARRPPAHSGHHHSRSAPRPVCARCRLHPALHLPRRLSAERLPDGGAARPGDRHAAGAAARSRPSLRPHPGPLVRALSGAGPGVAQGSATARISSGCGTSISPTARGASGSAAISLVQLEAAKPGPARLVR